MTAPAAVFRCDAGLTLGAGHVMRCFALEAALRGEGWKTSFITIGETLKVLPSMASKDHLVAAGNEPDRSAIVSRFGETVDWLIVDHRTLEREFESKARTWARHVLVIEDFPNRAHDCDLLLDQTAGREPGEYADCVPEQCRVVTGAAFALLRPEFANARRKLARNRDGSGQGGRLLLSFGATDPYGLTAPLVAELIKQDALVQIDIVCGTNADQAIAALAAQQPERISLHVAVSNMVELMMQANLGVGVGGTTAWERCALGLPSAMFIPNEYHRLFTERLAGTGVAEIVGDYRDLSMERAARRILSLLHDRQRLAEMSRVALTLCDGDGAKRMAREMSATMKSSSPIDMSKA